MSGAYTDRGSKLIVDPDEYSRLRDEMAMRAMQGMATALAKEIQAESIEGIILDRISRHAYQQADAMLEERKNERHS